MSGFWRVTGVSTNGAAADIGDDTHCVANGIRTDKAELICHEHNTSLAAQEVIERLRGALIGQWAVNHSEHCSNTDIFHEQKEAVPWFNSPGPCYWPLPDGITVEQARATLAAAQPAAPAIKED